MDIETMRKIVDGAPKTATTVRISLCGKQFLYGRCDNSVGGSIFNLADLRTAIADHDRTDHVTDIRNHISPMTIVLEK